MEFAFRRLPLILLLASALAQYDEFHGYEGHELDGYKQPVIQHQSLDEHHADDYDLDYHAHPKYTFDYSVKDPHTGDDKEHWETRDGDKVKGSYTLVETDGTKRVVEYEADDKNGFNAIVHKIGTPVEHQDIHTAKQPLFEPAEYQPEYQHGEEYVSAGDYEH